MYGFVIMYVKFSASSMVKFSSSLRSLAGMNSTYGSEGQGGRGKRAYKKTPHTRDQTHHNLALTNLRIDVLVQRRHQLQNL